MGSHALKALAGPGYPLKKVHGRPPPRDGRVLFPLYHPAPGFYREELRQVLEADMAALGEYLQKTNRTATWP